MAAESQEGRLGCDEKMGGQMRAVEVRRAQQNRFANSLQPWEGSPRKQSAGCSCRSNSSQASGFGGQACDGELGKKVEALNLTGHHGRGPWPGENGRVAFRGPHAKISNLLSAMCLVRRSGWDAAPGGMSPVPRTNLSERGTPLLSQTRAARVCFRSLRQAIHG